MEHAGGNGRISHAPDISSLDVSIRFLIPSPELGPSRLRQSITEAAEELLDAIRRGARGARYPWTFKFANFVRGGGAVIFHFHRVGRLLLLGSAPTTATAASSNAA